MPNKITPKNVFTDEFIVELLYLISRRILAFFVALIIVGFILFNFAFSVNSGDSMNPTILDNSIMIVKQDKDLSIGDIVVLHSPENDDLYTKRIIGEPGDTINLKYGELHVNNVKKNEKYVKGLTFCNSIDYAINYKIPDNEYYVLGDNREDSMDSRVFGSVKKDLIIGKVVYIFPTKK